MQDKYRVVPFRVESGILVLSSFAIPLNFLSVKTKRGRLFFSLQGKKNQRLFFFVWFFFAAYERGSKGRSFSTPVTAGASLLHLATGSEISQLGCIPQSQIL